MRRLTLVLAFGLVAAACGNGASSAAFQVPGTTATTPPPAATAATPAPSDDATPATGPSDATTTSGVAPAPTELPDSDYPDVVVADLAGGDVNLRELALEARPVLLWFWAPH